MTTSRYFSVTVELGINAMKLLKFLVAKTMDEGFECER